MNKRAPTQRRGLVALVGAVAATALLSFTPAFEHLIERWDADWARTWNDYTRRLVITPATDFDAVGARLRKEFAGA